MSHIICPHRIASKVCVPQRTVLYRNHVVSKRVYDAETAFLNNQFVYEIARWPCIF